MCLSVFDKFTRLSRIEQEHIWYSYLMPFDLPEDPTLLYELIRERLVSDPEAPVQ